MTTEVTKHRKHQSKSSYCLLMWIIKQSPWRESEFRSRGRSDLLNVRFAICIFKFPFPRSPGKAPAPGRMGKTAKSDLLSRTFREYLLSSRQAALIPSGCFFPIYPSNLHEDQFLQRLSVSGVQRDTSAWLSPNKITSNSRIFLSRNLSNLLYSVTCSRNCILLAIVPCLIATMQ